MRLMVIVLVVLMVSQGNFINLDGVLWDLTYVKLWLLFFWQDVLFQSQLLILTWSYCPKKRICSFFSDLRSISLSNFLNKVLSRIIHDRIEKVIPKIISPNQSGFVKGRRITENVLLVKEIICDIRIRGKLTNVVIKLDMGKAYDRVD